MSVFRTSATNIAEISEGRHHKMDEHWIPWPLRWRFWVPLRTILIAGAIGLEVAYHITQRDGKFSLYVNESWLNAFSRRMASSAGIFCTHLRPYLSCCLIQHQCLTLSQRYITGAISLFFTMLVTWTATEVWKFQACRLRFCIQLVDLINCSPILSWRKDHPLQSRLSSSTTETKRTHLLV